MRTFQRRFCAPANGRSFGPERTIRGGTEKDGDLGVFYVGLANRGYAPKTFVEKGEHAYAFADKASGSILRLEH